MSPLLEALVEVPLPLFLELVATDISLYDNEGAIGKLGVVGGTTKNESCRELRYLHWHSRELAGTICAGCSRARVQ